MYQCKRCDVEFLDGVQCSVCQGRYDFPCAGITEGGYRKLGDRKSVWKCTFCKNPGSSPLNVPHTKPSSSKTKSPVPTDLESIATDIKCLTAKVAALPELLDSLRSIQADIADLKTLKQDIADLKVLKHDVDELKSSMEFTQNTLDALAERVSVVEERAQDFSKAKDEVQVVEHRLNLLHSEMQEYNQRLRLNNIEIKGVPMSPNENLFSIVLKIADLAKFPISKDQIDYIARVPTRNDKHNKSIILSMRNRYLKDDLVATAKKCTLTSKDIGLQGSSRIYINDHLTVDNKILLNKTKLFAKERNFVFTWVKGCKIFIRKNPTSPVIVIKSEADLSRLSR